MCRVLWWQDSGACLKAVGVVGQVLRWLAGEGQHLSPDAVQQVMMAVLRGLHTHGQHDANQSALLSLGLAIYEMFRPNFPNIREACNFLHCNDLNSEKVNCLFQYYVRYSQNFGMTDALQSS